MVVALKKLAKKLKISSNLLFLISLGISYSNKLSFSSIAILKSFFLNSISLKSKKSKILTETPSNLTFPKSTSVIPKKLVFKGSNSSEKFLYFIGNFSKAILVNFTSELVSRKSSCLRVISISLFSIGFNSIISFTTGSFVSITLNSSNNLYFSITLGSSIGLKFSTSLGSSIW